MVFLCFLVIYGFSVIVQVSHFVTGYIFATRNPESHSIFGLFRLVFLHYSLNIEVYQGFNRHSIPCIIMQIHAGLLSSISG